MNYSKEFSEINSNLIELENKLSMLVNTEQCDDCSPNVKKTILFTLDQLKNINHKLSNEKKKSKKVVIPKNSWVSKLGEEI